MTETLDVTPLSNAADSLARVAESIADFRSGRVLAFKAALAWGWHAVGLLAYARLQPARDTFDAWLQDYLQVGEPSLSVDRDAHWQERERLSFLELLDLLSEPELPILRPEFFQGWQDRQSRCEALRRQLGELLGASLSATAREQLLLLLAAYHRLVRLPAGVRLKTRSLQEAFPALINLCETLVDDQVSEAHAIVDGIARCWQSLDAG